MQGASGTRSEYPIGEAELIPPQHESRVDLEKLTGRPRSQSPGGNQGNRGSGGHVRAEIGSADGGILDEDRDQFLKRANLAGDFHDSLCMTRLPGKIPP